MTVTQTEKVFGTQSAQSVLLLTSVKSEITPELVSRLTGYNKRALYNAINNLISVGILERVSRGKYRLKKVRSAQKLRVGYREIAIEHIGKKLVEIEEKIEAAESKENLLEQLSELSKLEEQFSPLIHEHFPNALSEYANRILGRVKEFE